MSNPVALLTQGHRRSYTQLIRRTPSDCASFWPGYSLFGFLDELCRWLYPRARLCTCPHPAHFAPPSTKTSPCPRGRSAPGIWSACLSNSRTTPNVSVKKSEPLVGQNSGDLKKLGQKDRSRGYTCRIFWIFHAFEIQLCIWYEQPLRALWKLSE